MANYTESFKGKMDWQVVLQRTNPIPIDRSSMFSSYADAVAYAKGDGSDSRGLGATAYPGQLVAVYENDAVTVYVVTADHKLNEITNSRIADGKSIENVDPNGSNKLQLFDFDSAEEGQHLRVKNIAAEGEPANLVLEWYDAAEPDDILDELHDLEEYVGDPRVIDEQTGDITTESTGLTHVVDLIGDRTTALEDRADDLEEYVGTPSSVDPQSGDPIAATGLTKTVEDLAAKEQDDYDTLDQKIDDEIDALETTHTTDVARIDAKDTEQDGRLDAVEADIETLNGNATVTGSVDNKIATALEDYYDQDEIDGMISGAFHYKGVYTTFADLVAAVEAGTITPVVGDVYNITTAGGTDSFDNPIKAGDNVVCRAKSTSGDPEVTTYTWDVLSGITDLSNYYTKSEVNTISTNDRAYTDTKVAAEQSARETAETEINARVDSLLTSVGATNNRANTLTNGTTIVAELDTLLDPDNTAAGSLAKMKKDLEDAIDAAADAAQDALDTAVATINDAQDVQDDRLDAVEAAITLLNNTADTEGSVANSIKEVLGADVYNATKDGVDPDTGETIQVQKTVDDFIDELNDRIDDLDDASSEKVEELRYSKQNVNHYFSNLAIANNAFTYDSTNDVYVASVELSALESLFSNTHSLPSQYGSAEHTLTYAEYKEELSNIEQFVPFVNPANRPTLAASISNLNLISRARFYPYAAITANTSGATPKAMLTVYAKYAPTDTIYVDVVVVDQHQADPVPNP